MALYGPVFGHLRTRLVLLHAALFVLAMVGVSASLHLVVTHTAEARLRRDLIASGAVYDRLWQQRAAQLRDAARILARDPGLRTAVAAQDRGAVAFALGRMKAQLGLPLAFLVDIGGDVTGIPDPATAAEAAALSGELDRDGVAGVTTLGGAARHIVAAPILAPALSGWVVLATDLDRPDMDSLESLAAIPLSARVYQRRADGGWIAADGSRLRPRASIEALLAEDMAADPPSTIDGDAGRAIAFARPLPTMPSAPATVLLLQTPLDQAVGAYRPLQIAIGLFTLAGLALIVIVTARMARSITRPIALLEEAAGKLADGDMATVPIASHDEVGRLAATFNRMADAIGERERRIAHLAFNDVLTGLPNRALFQEQLDRELRLAERRNGGVAVFCLDLDQFKAINDTLGHPVGDEVLRLVSRRLSELPDDVFVARLGGDEFAIILPLPGGPSDVEDVEALGRRIIDLLQAPDRIAKQDIEPRASIGIAVSPDDGTDTETLLRNADLALYQAKESGRNTIRFFEAALDARAQARRSIEIDLKRAISEGELELYFQPLIDLQHDHICAFEALIRWRHPTRGLVQPMEFIPIAEETGLIIPIGAWVMREACRQAAGWGGHIRVAVNVSTVQFQRPGLAQVAMQALQSSGLPPSCLEIEITESVFLASADQTLKLLHDLRALGVRVALDDFGTGYSSLSYLQSFPFDKIKIDRSFVSSLAQRTGASAIVRAVVDLAGALGMETTAEGVEEHRQLAELRTLGCSSVQGYLFSRPVPGADVPALIRRLHRPIASVG